MKAVISVNFKKILGKKVNDKLLEENPNLPDVTRQTIRVLCTQIKKYFHEHKIKVGVEFELK
jgi:hypothetical protein